MSSYVDATPRAGDEVAEGGDRPPPPSHRSERRPSANTATPSGPAVAAGPAPPAEGAARHRAALLAASLAPGEEPPFLTEPTVAVPARPAAPLGDRLSELAYRRRAIMAVPLVVVVLAAAALVSRGGGGNDEAEGPPPSLADGGAALMEPVRAALAAFGSTVRSAPSVTSGSAGSAGDEGSTTVRQSTTVAQSSTIPPPTAPATTATARVEVPGTVQPRFCTVWIDDPLEVLSAPDDDATVAGQVGIGLYWAAAVTEDRPRWYLIDTGGTRGWVRGDDVDRQGDCRGRG